MEDIVGPYVTFEMNYTLSTEKFSIFKVNYAKIIQM